MANSNTTKKQSDNNGKAAADGEAQGAQGGVRGRGWHGNSEGHAEAGRKGGQTVSKNREHMAEIGRKGGQAVSKNREHMAQIGRKGGQSRSEQSTEETVENAAKPSRRQNA